MLRNFFKIKLLFTLSVCALVGSSCSKIEKTESAEAIAANPKIDKLKLPEGFKAEHLYSPSENEQGSWVSMTFDDKGRMITGSTTILDRVPIDTIEWKFNEKEKAYLLTWYQDDPAKNNFYRYMINRDSLGRSSSRDFVASDELTNGKRVSYGSSYDFEKSDTLVVSLYHVEEQYHDFLGSITDAKNANGNPFAQPSRIKSTVKGGIGVFTNLAFDRKTVIIQ